MQLRVRENITTGRDCVTSRGCCFMASNVPTVFLPEILLSVSFSVVHFLSLVGWLPMSHRRL